MLDSYYLLEAKEDELVWNVDEHQFCLFSWGPMNQAPENRERQRKLGVHGVIYDRYVGWTNYFL